MATVLYIDPNTESGPTTAQTLGCGWDPTGGANAPLVAGQTPCVLIRGAGQTVIIPAAQATPAAVLDALTPLLDAEQTAAQTLADQYLAAVTTLQACVAQLAPGISQGDTDAAAVQALIDGGSTDPLAPIILRLLQGVKTIVQATAVGFVLADLVEPEVLEQAGI